MAGPIRELDARTPALGGSADPVLLDDTMSVGSIGTGLLVERRPAEGAQPPASVETSYATTAAATTSRPVPTDAAATTANTSSFVATSDSRTATSMTAAPSTTIDDAPTSTAATGPTIDDATTATADWTTIDDATTATAGSTTIDDAPTSTAATGPTIDDATTATAGRTTIDDAMAATAGSTTIDDAPTSTEDTTPTEAERRDDRDDRQRGARNRDDCDELCGQRPDRNWPRNGPPRDERHCDDCDDCGGAVATMTALSVYRTGRWDPTMRLVGTSLHGEMWRATLTPEGAGTLRLRWHGEAIEAAAWGPGADWLLASVPGLTGRLDRPVRFERGHPPVLRAQHRHPGLRLAASGTLYHDLLPVIIAQRITGLEANQQWYRLVRELGRPAPGPNPDLRCPPMPSCLAARPAWWYHRLGIEARRAEALRTVARHADRIDEWARLDPAACRAKLELLPGIGPWTIGSVLGPSLGDPDAFAIGDYHLKNDVAYALAGEARGTDERMVELLAPYVGQRGRVVRLLQLDTPRAPKFGPRQRILPMRRW